MGHFDHAVKLEMARRSHDKDERVHLRINWSPVDYKTSKSAKYADLKQLDAMAACIFRMFPEVKRIKSALLFVVSNEFVHKEHFCDTDYLKGFQFDLERLETAIGTGVWNAVSGPLCGWCPVTSCVHYREPRKRR